MIITKQQLIAARENMKIHAVDTLTKCPFCKHPKANIAFPLFTPEGPEIHADGNCPACHTKYRLYFKLHDLEVKSSTAKCIPFEELPD